MFFIELLLFLLYFYCDDTFIVIGRHLLCCDIHCVFGLCYFFMTAAAQVAHLGKAKLKLDLEANLSLQ